MGQYFRPTFIEADGNEKKVFFARPRNIFESPAKLMETSWWQNPYVNAMLSVIKDNPCTVAWIGDYASEGKPIAPPCQFSAAEQKHFFSVVFADDGRATLIEQAQFVESEDYYSKLLERPNNRGFLLDHTKKTYFDLDKYTSMYRTAVPTKKQQEERWLPHPLPLLTAVGNKRGGGDFYGKTGADMVGIWAFDTITWTSKVPSSDYKDETALFLED